MLGMAERSGGPAGESSSGCARGPAVSIWVMKLIALAIILAGAAVAAAIAYGPRERALVLGNGYVVEDRWTGVVRYCALSVSAELSVIPGTNLRPDSAGVVKCIAGEVSPSAR